MPLIARWNDAAGARATRPAAGTRRALVRGYVQLAEWDHASARRPGFVHAVIYCARAA